MVINLPQLYLGHILIASNHIKKEAMENVGEHYTKHR